MGKPLRKSLLRGWNVMRSVRLALGVAVVVQGIAGSDWAFIVLGTLFSLMPLLNIGCCGSGGCTVPPRQDSRPKEDFTYEEVR